jgi:hypothetical protein
MPFLRFIDREPAAAVFALAGLTAIVVLASLGEPVVGGVLVAGVAGYVTARSLTDAGRDEMYRATDRVLGLMWLVCLVLLAGLAVDWIGLVDPAGDVSRLEAFGWGVPAACVVGFVHGAWHEHLERMGQNQIA